MQALSRDNVPVHPRRPELTDIEKLQRRLQAFADERDWNQFHSPKNLSMALIVEAGELAEHFQWLTQEESFGLADDKREAVGEELADIFVYLVRLADQLDIEMPHLQDTPTRLPDNRKGLGQQGVGRLAFFKAFAELDGLGPQRGIVQCLQVWLERIDLLDRLEHALDDPVVTTTEYLPNELIEH